jgi:hypothetical protein
MAGLVAQQVAAWRLERRLWERAQEPLLVEAQTPPLTPERPV